MIEAGSDYGIYLYTGKVDMRKGIDVLCGVIRQDMGRNPMRPKSIFIFSGRNPRVKKVLVREFNRYELTVIRLDEGRFIRPETSSGRSGGQIRWSDFRLLTEASVKDIMNENCRCAMSDIPADAKICYVNVRGDGDLNLVFTTKPFSELRGDDWNDAPYEHNAGFPYHTPDEFGKTFLVSVPHYSPEDCDEDVENPPMSEWEILNEDNRCGLSFSVYDHLSGVCAWMKKYEAHSSYSPESVLDAHTTFAQFIERISPEDRAVLEFFHYEHYFE